MKHLIQHHESLGITVAFDEACQQVEAWGRRVLEAILGMPVGEIPLWHETFDESVAYVGPGDCAEEFVEGERYGLGLPTMGIQIQREQSYYVYFGGNRDNRGRLMRLESYGFPEEQSIRVYIDSSSIHLAWQLNAALDRIARKALVETLRAIQA